MSAETEMFSGFVVRNRKRVSSRVMDAANSNLRGDKGTVAEYPVSLAILEKEFPLLDFERMDATKLFEIILRFIIEQGVELYDSNDEVLVLVGQKTIETLKRRQEDILPKKKKKKVEESGWIIEKFRNHDEDLFPQDKTQELFLSQLTVAEILTELADEALLAEKICE